ncbi:hypothetical protein VTJ83DRAFT_5889 [Remersonia thermophila]|uniref:Uncharacterized protein n=1 Tax=Remersonia thermophila TaxID=72144 RepID=A0ABR4DAC3_9PEZI
MSTCPMVVPSSVEYLTGSPPTGLGPFFDPVCPVESVPDSDSLGSMTPFFLLLANMVLALLSYAAQAGGAVIKLGLRVLGFAFVPIFATLRTLFSVVSTILGLVVSPFFTPWRVTSWVVTLFLDLCDEFKPIILYYMSAILTGAIAGLLVGALTLLVLRILHVFIPFLRPRSQRPGEHHRRHNKPKQRSSLSSLAQVTPAESSSVPQGNGKPSHHRSLNCDDLPYDIPSSSSSASPTPSEDDYDADTADATSSTATKRRSSSRSPTAASSPPSSSSSCFSRRGIPSDTGKYPAQRYQYQHHQTYASLSSSSSSPPSSPSLSRRVGSRAAARAGSLVEDTIHEESSD